MARAHRSTELTTSEARKRLPKLVRNASSRRSPAKSPKARAVEIKPRDEEGSASLVPTMDLDAAEARISELEEEVENAGIALFLHERLAKTSGERLSAEEFLTEIGMDEFVERLPNT